MKKEFQSDNYDGIYSGGDGGVMPPEFVPVDRTLPGFAGSRVTSLNVIVSYSGTEGLDDVPTEVNTPTGRITELPA